MDLDEAIRRLTYWFDEFEKAESEFKDFEKRLHTPIERLKIQECYRLREELLNLRVIIRLSSNDFHNLKEAIDAQNRSPWYKRIFTKI